MNLTAQQGAAALTLAVHLYRQHVAESGVHENRMPSWQELDCNQKRAWIDKASFYTGEKIVTDTKTYIGTKVVKGTPMTRGDYNHLRGWAIPVGENPSDAGYLVEYMDGGPANHPAYHNYISWSPAAVFEKAYLPAEDGLTFSQALELLKSGARVSRAGWNGAGQFVFMMDQNGQAYVFKGEHEPLGLAPVLALKNAQNVVQPGWVPSQGDMFAKDWKSV